MHKTQLERSRMSAVELDGYLKYRQAAMQCAGRLDRQGAPILMLLTFDQWWSIWQNSGHWAERGCHLGQYFMKRHDFMGSYEINNISIALRVAAIQRARAECLVTCPHCGKTGNRAAMFRWHFDACLNL